MKQHKPKEDTLPAYTITPHTDDEYPIYFNDTTNDSDMDFGSDTSFSYQFVILGLTGPLQNSKNVHYKTIKPPEFCRIFTLQQKTNSIPEESKSQPVKDNPTPQCQGHLQLAENQIFQDHASPKLQTCKSLQDFLKITLRKILQQRASTANHSKSSTYKTKSSHQLYCASTK